MGIFDGKAATQTGILREDYKIDTCRLQVDPNATDVLTKLKGVKREFSWCLLHQLMKPAYGVPGIPDGTPLLLLCQRDVRFDPLGELDKTWSDENIKEKMIETAKEQQYKTESKNNSMMTMTTGLLAASVVILVLAIAAVGLLKYYGG